MSTCDPSPVAAVGQIMSLGNGGVLRLKGEVSQTWIDVDGDRATNIRSLDVDVNRVRVSLEARQPWAISHATKLQSTLEVGARHDRFIPMARNRHRT